MKQKGSSMVVSENMNGRLITITEQVQQPYFNVVIFDIDSTLATIEGIDTLAEIAGQYERVAALTEKVMNGEVPVGEVFSTRLKIIRAQQEHLNEVANRYIENIVPGALELFEDLRSKGKEIFLVSGAYEEILGPLARTLQVPPSHVYANKLMYQDGFFQLDVNHPYPLWQSGGKKIVRQLIQKTYPGRAVIVGDSITDAEAANETDIFICFAGIAVRTKALSQAQYVIHTPDLLQIIDVLETIEQTASNQPSFSNNA